MEHRARVWLALGLAAAVSGCSETRFADMMGAGKNVPDETQVRTTQTLSMPPDLQLRAPTAVAAEDGQPNTAAYSPPAGSQPAAQPPPTRTAAATPATAAVGQPAQAQTTDPYESRGISKTKPDGTAKTENELANELHAAVIAEKRRRNPSYGTIWNIGNIFKDE